ncbi:hypothetical protein L1887_43402 [Cichorium endivia]|nr:hypothetical protein L1887_43402 [Cichorium endivia]
MRQQSLAWTDRKWTLGQSKSATRATESAKHAFIVPSASSSGARWRPLERMICGPRVDGQRSDRTPRILVDSQTYRDAAISLPDQQRAAALSWEAVRSIPARGSRRETNKSDAASLRSYSTVLYCGASRPKKILKKLLGRWHLVRYATLVLLVRLQTHHLCSFLSRHTRLAAVSARLGIK